MVLIWPHSLETGRRTERMGRASLLRHSHGEKQNVDDVPLVYMWCRVTGHQRTAAAPVLRHVFSDYQALLLQRKERQDMKVQHICL